MQNYKIEYDGKPLPSIEASSESAARLIAKVTHKIPLGSYLKLSVCEGGE